MQRESSSECVQQEHSGYEAWPRGALLCSFGGACSLVECARCKKVKRSCLPCQSWIGHGGTSKGGRAALLEAELPNVDILQAQRAGDLQGGGRAHTGSEAVCGGQVSSAGPTCEPASQVWVGVATDAVPALLQAALACDSGTCLTFLNSFLASSSRQARTWRGRAGAEL